MLNAINDRFSAITTTVFVATLGALALSGCASDSNDLITSASTVGTTAYLTHEADEDDFARAREFADTRAVALRRDAARGHGEDLDTFAALMGADHEQRFGAWMQTHYAELYESTPDNADVVDRVLALR